MPYKPSFKRRTVTSAFREWVLQRFNVTDHTPEWRFICYALLGRESKNDDGGLPVPVEWVAYLEGERLAEGDRKYTAQRFLRQMQERFPELELSWIDGKPGVRVRVLHRKLPPDVLERVQIELSDLPPESERIRLLDGTKIDRRKRKQYRDEDLRHVTAVNASREKEANDDERLMLEMLNTRLPHHFTKLIDKNMEAAKEAVRKLKPEQQEREFNILENIERQPMQLYKYSERSTRLAPDGYGIVALKTKIRRVLTRGWTEVDLKSVQLAVNAGIWGLSELQAFLKSGKSWWDELFEWFGIEPDPHIKRLLKRATYAMCYGATKKTIQYGDTDDDGNVLEGLGQYTERFFEHPLVQELWKARNRLLRQITVEGGMRDAYGRWIAIDRHRDVDKRSVLCQVSQSYEQAIIAEIFKLAATTDAFEVVLYQSDGVHLVFKDKRRKRQWMAKIREAVVKRAEELGVYTDLEEVED